jgi:type II secretory ATPase GspE/PulE/Tfp pilus assembly ATPase PilB-like protein
MSAGDDLTGQDIVTPDQLESALQIHKAKSQPKLGGALLQENLITHKQLNVALQKQIQDRKTPLGQILVGMGATTEEVIRRVLSQRFGIAGLNLREFRIDPEMIKAIPAALARKYMAMPLYRAESRMVIAMEDPIARESLQALELCVQMKIDPVLAQRTDLEFVMQRFYGAAEARPKPFLVPSSEPGTIQQPVEVAAEDVFIQSDDALVQLINEVVLDAIEQGASEIHVESIGDGQSGRVRFRRDGIMTPHSEISAEFVTSVISQIKLMSGLDTSEKWLSQEGKIKFVQPDAAKIELRVVTMPTTDDLEDVVMRMVSAPEAIAVGDLDLTPQVLDKLKDLAVKPQGLLLVCGPAGSGKTTTLHSLLGHINTSDRKIWTAEDPIEITQDGLRQVEINAKIGWTFAAVLRGLLNAGPDVIMVGETRDFETAKAVVEASLTGRLVLSALRANSAAETVVRLLNLGLDPFNLADALLAVVGQRLVWRLCTACRTPYAMSADETEILAQHYCFNTELNPAEVISRWRTQFAGNGDSLTIFSPTGCEECNHTGYKGRIGVYELLLASPAMTKKIHAKADVEEISRVATTEGMQTIRQDGIEKILQGHTDLDQVQAVCP